MFESTLDDERRAFEAREWREAMLPIYRPDYAPSALAEYDPREDANSELPGLMGEPEEDFSAETIPTDIF